jgi:rfaE bifunctional protein nucleotidyltransferase chain/domain
MRKVFVNGSFDILHLGHLALLEFARSQGDWLLVGIDSDSRIKQLKGADRPVNTEIERRTMLEAIKYVDQVAIFNTDQELCDLIKSCDVMIKGSDYFGKPIVGGNLVPMVFFERINEYSTTKKIQDINSRRFVH